MRKKILLLALVVAASLLTVVAAQIYWERTINYNFEVIGVEAVLVPKTYDGYRLKTVATALDSNRQIILTVISENFEDLWLNITQTCNCTGLVVTAQGQYVDVYWTGPSTGTIALVGSPFDVFGYHVVDKTKMMWKNPGNTVVVPQPHGYGLLISFNFDTELVTLPGNYQSSLKFQMGFV